VIYTIFPQPAPLEQRTEKCKIRLSCFLEICWFIICG
jgi:hypothetical protein